MTAGAAEDTIEALDAYESGLRAGRARLIVDTGHAMDLPLAAWAGSPTDADAALLDRCTGPTLDVGCGPGRMTAALTARGVPALGMDVSPMAIAMTVARGALALERNIFTAGPGVGRWQHVLLADGNIGIGGDPIRLLMRCAELLTAGGSVLADLAPPGTGMVTRRTRLQVDGRTSRSFAWGWLGVDVLHEHAARVGLAPVAVWCTESRWQAELVVTTSRTPSGRNR